MKRTRPRTILATAGVLLLLGATPLAAAEPTPRTETSLGGYKLLGHAAPLTVLVDDPAIPLPREQGDPIVHADESYTRALLSTGPQSRAVAATVWPGPIIGDGLPTILGSVPGAPQEEYPLKADAKYPGGPIDDTGPEGTSLTAAAHGLDVKATSRSAESPSPAVADFAGVESTTTSTVSEKGLATTAAVAVAEGVSLAAGVITVDSVRSSLTATSDGRVGTSAGGTTVSGLTIAGTGYVVDEKGVRPVQEGKPGDPVAPAPAPPVDPLKELGITVEPIAVTSNPQGSTAHRATGGLRIVIDTAPFSKALNDGVAPLPLGPVVEQLPPEAQGLFFTLLSSTPQITYILGDAEVTSAANLPLTFPTIADIPIDVTDTTVAGQPFTGGAFPGVAPITDATGLAPLASAPVGAEQSAAAPEVLAVVPQRSELGPGFTGISAVLLLLALGASFGLARGLIALQTAALAGGIAGSGCSLGATSAVPNLRSA